MASFKSVLPLWRHSFPKGSPILDDRARSLPMAPAGLASTSQELMLDHLVDLATSDRRPSSSSQRCGR